MRIPTQRDNRHQLDDQRTLFPIGGQAVMREQLEHLLVRARLTNVTLQVLPSSVGAFPGIGTAYHVVSFEPGEAGAVYLENLNDGVYLEDEIDVAAYTLNFERQREAALDPKASISLIEAIIGGL